MGNTAKQPVKKTVKQLVAEKQAAKAEKKKLSAKLAREAEKRMVKELAAARDKLVECLVGYEYTENRSYEKHGTWGDNYFKVTFKDDGVDRHVYLVYRVTTFADVFVSIGPLINVPYISDMRIEQVPEELANYLIREHLV